jgi:hypothetical protein
MDYLSCYMPTLYQQITDKFLSKLATTKEFDEKKIERLRAILADSKKMKADDIAQVFSGGIDDEIE